MSAGPGAGAADAPEPGAHPTRARPTRHEEPTGRHLAALCLTSLGVVYGDIGTSPLYAFREAFHPQHGVPPTTDAVHGVLSMIVWSPCTSSPSATMRFEGP